MLSALSLTRTRASMPRYFCVTSAILRKAFGESPAQVPLLLSRKPVSIRRYVSATRVMSRRAVEESRARCPSNYCGNACQCPGIIVLRVLYRGMSIDENGLCYTQGEKFPDFVSREIFQVRKLGNGQRNRREEISSTTT